MNKEPEPFPLFKGATRIPTVAGVPLIPLMLMIVVVASLAMLFSLWYWALALPSWFIMAQITKNDDRAFRIWGLWFETKCRNSFSSSFWNASSYSKADYRGACGGMREDMR